jgi:uncharacterized Ntn-hydrolase superfamily protein
MTYSIVARDPESGHMGVATQSQAFAVGSSVSWALPGYGVIATQSTGEPMYGELGLEVLRSGLTAAEALEALRTVDPHPERRQVAMVDGRGGVAAYTGEACVPEAGHRLGDCCATLANLMASDRSWDAMADAFATTNGPLAGRLLAALRAAEAEGGDLRGRRSAAILVVEATRSGRPWRDQVVDLRVDDHPDPVDELARMVAYNDRYHRFVEAFELALDGQADDALAIVGDATTDPTREPDLTLWRAVVLAQAGRDDDAAALLHELGEIAPGFVEAARRFGRAGIVDADLLGELLPEAPGPRH